MKGALFEAAQQRKRIEELCYPIHFSTLVALAHTHSKEAHLWFLKALRDTFPNQTPDNGSPLAGTLHWESCNGRRVLRVTQRSNVRIHPGGAVKIRETVYGYGTVDTDFTLYFTNKKKATLSRKLDLAKYNLLPAGVSYLADIPADCIQAISRWCSGWDLLALRMVNKRFSGIMRNGFIWKHKLARVRECLSIAPSLFQSVPVHRQFSNLAICFHYQPKSPKTKHLGNDKYERAVKAIKTQKHQYLWQNVAKFSGEEGCTFRLPDPGSSILRCYNSLPTKAAFGYVVPRQNGNGTEFYPVSWVTKKNRLVTKSRKNKRGVKRGRVEPFFMSYHEYLDKITIGY